MSVIKSDMKIKLCMEGVVNGHSFVIEGDGTGKPFEGKQIMDVVVKQGAPLPFAFDILTTAFHYGNRVFAEYPDHIPDYFKQSFPEGFSWERSLKFEDGGVCIAWNNISYAEEDAEMGAIHREMYVRDGVLTGDITMALLLQGGAHYRCDFRTSYKTKKRGVKLPSYHFVNNCIEITGHDKDYKNVKLYEHALAHSGLPGSTGQ